MALIKFNFESEFLGGNTEISVIMPDKPRTEKANDFYSSGAKYPVLWLLHGTFGDHTDWIRRSMIETHVRKKNIMVVCPSGLNANYANWPSFATGYNMYDYLLEELMPLIHNWFPASDKREDNFIAGLSMGGMGVCTYAFNHPEKFGGAACLSGYPTDIREMYESNDPMWDRWGKTAINYEKLEDYLDGYENTMKVLRENVANKVDMPKLMFACGEKDFLYPKFKEFREEAENELKIDAKWFVLSDYKHEWPFWDIAIVEAMKYFGLFDRDSYGNPF